MRMRDGGGVVSEDTPPFEVSCNGLASAMSISIDWTGTSDLASVRVSFTVLDVATVYIELPSCREADRPTVTLREPRRTIVQRGEPPYAFDICNRDPTRLNVCSV